MTWENMGGKSSHLYIRFFSTICRATYFHSQKKRYSDEISSHLERLRREENKTTIDQKVSGLTKNKLQKIELIEKQLQILEYKHKKLSESASNPEYLDIIENKISYLKKRISDLKN